MQMRDFHCRGFELSFRLKAESFDKGSFLREIESFEDADKEDKKVYLSFASSTDPDSQHSHINVRFYSQDEAHIVISYHSFAGDIENARPPYMEDCAQWLASFVKDDEVTAHVNTSYLFDAAYSPSVPLPFPLTTPDKPLSGVFVTGLALQFPEDAEIENALVQHEGEETPISVYKQVVVNLKEFDWYAELEKLSVSVMSLVKRQGGYDENSREA